MPFHDELVADIDSCNVREGHCAFWWLGQHSFVVKLERHVLYIDPFLSDEPDRLLPPVLNPDELTNADLIFGSHDHSDHIDRKAWPEIASVPNVRFVVPELIKDSLSLSLNIDIERFIGINDGRSADADGVEITGIAAAHEFLDRDVTSGRYPYLGYIIKADGVTLYHAGDTCIYEGLISKLKRWELDVAFLRVNGRDATRLAAGCIGNMTFQEAADLAGVLEPGLTVPAHFGMFSNNTVDPQLFMDYMRVKYPALNVCLCQPGKQYVGSNRRSNIQVTRNE